MAECAAQPDGSFILAENHCPICVAAKSCQGLCREELDLFRAALGPGRASNAPITFWPGPGAAHM